MAKTLIASQQSNSQAIKPYLIYSKLRSVCKHLVFGQQEDAHEFLRYLMEAMEKAYLSRFPKSSQLDQYSKETTPINQILGGYLKTSVRCLACGHVSVTFSHFEDLLLDIRKANTLEEALDLYFARERLEDMGYKCESCKKKVSATKQFSLERAPISLCIQLKRFSIVGNKLNKHITVRQHLNLSKYSSRKCPNDQQLNYRLVSMITHLGASQHCGHYTAIGLTEAGSYYQFDDSYVRQIPVQNVLNTNAYIMFYELDTSAGKSQSPLAPTECNKFSTNGERIRPYLGPSQNSITTTVTSTTSPRFIGPLLPTSKLLANSNGDSSSMSPTTHENGTENTAKDTLSSSASLMSSLNSTEKSTSNFVNKANLGSKLVHSFRKVETSPTCKLTSNGAIYNTNTANSSTDTSSQASKTSLLQCNGYEPKKVTNQDSSSSEDDQDNDEDDFDNDKGSMLNTKMLPTLPSMPKLETPPESTENNEKAVSDSTTGSSSGTQSKMKNTLLPKPAAFMKGTSSLYANGKTGDQKNREPDSDSSDSDDYSSKPSFMSNAKHTVNKAVATKAKSSIPILLNNGNSRQHKLVPYDDSEYDSGAESPPEVNTKAGPFQVTNTNETPRVVSSFMRGSTERLPVKQVPATTTIGSSNCSSNSSNNQFLSNGARIFNGRRESEGNLVVKTAASLVNQNNKRPNEWHGSEQTANKLLKLSHRGYGGSVSSWNGQKSAMEKEVITSNNQTETTYLILNDFFFTRLKVSDERKEELKRQTLNAGDAEMDRGHKKKTNSKLVLSRDNPGYNPFQESQNQRNTWTISSGSNGHSANGTSSYANRPHNKIYRMKHHNHKFYKNNNRFNRNGSGGNGSHFNNNHFQRRQMNK